MSSTTTATTKPGIITFYMSEDNETGLTRLTSSEYVLFEVFDSEGHSMTFQKLQAMRKFQPHDYSIYVLSLSYSAPHAIYRFSGIDIYKLTTLLAGHSVVKVTHLAALTSRWLDQMYNIRLEACLDLNVLVGLFQKRFAGAVGPLAGRWTKEFTPTLRWHPTDLNGDDDRPVEKSIERSVHLWLQCSQYLSSGLLGGTEYALRLFQTKY